MSRPRNRPRLIPHSLCRTSRILTERRNDEVHSVIYYDINSVLRTSGDHRYRQKNKKLFHHLWNWVLLERGAIRIVTSIFVSSRINISFSAQDVFLKMNHKLLRFRSNIETVHLHIALY